MIFGSGKLGEKKKETGQQPDGDHSKLNHQYFKSLKIEKRQEMTTRSLKVTV